MRKFFSKIGNWIKENSLIVLYFIFAIGVEMVAVFAVEGKPFMTRPFLSLGLLLFICGIMFLFKSNRVRLAIGATLLILQAVIDLVFSVIFDMTDQYFDFGMLNLKNDAFGILESIPVNFITFYSGLFFCVVYIIYGARKTFFQKKAKKGKHSIYWNLGVCVAGVATLCGSFSVYFPGNTNKYEDMINGRVESAYSAYGMIGNAIGEFGGAMFYDPGTMPNEEIEAFIYGDGSEQYVSQPTEYFGVAEGKNVVVILGESLEWYAFMRDSRNPNELDISPETLKILYPNLTKFYENSVSMTNFHSREKTDISETLSIMGCYPTDSYINYDYTNNEMPHTMPNILKELSPVPVQCRSYHNGFKTFYNRDKVHDSFGFEFLTDMYDMEDYSNEIEDQGGEEIFFNWMEEGQRNLDSEMIEICKGEMFPTDERFYTYITTITMHGVYYERDNLERHREILLQHYQPDEDDDEEMVLFNYMQTAMEFDHAIGCMMEDLEKKGLLDNTMIAVFGDHPAYYQQLSSYVKNIKKYKNTEGNYTDLFKVPFMIYDQDLTAKIRQENPEFANKPITVEKFTCTADIVPTLLDLLGIRYYTNLCYGTSAFAEKQSVLYSRAYDIFVSDGIVGRSVNNLLFRDASVTDEMLATYKATGIELVNKIKHCDYIFLQDYFDDDGKLDLFHQKMHAINA